LGWTVWGISQSLEDDIQGLPSLTHCSRQKKP
jgi:hypothetical protein